METDSENHEPRSGGVDSSDFRIKTPPVILLKPADVAQRLGVAVSTLSKMRLSGTGPGFVKIGASVLYPEGEVDAFVGSLRVMRSTADIEENERRPNAGRRKRGRE